MYLKLKVFKLQEYMACEDLSCDIFDEVNSRNEPEHPCQICKTIPVNSINTYTLLEKISSTSVLINDTVVAKMASTLMSWRIGSDNPMSDVIEDQRREVTTNYELANLVCGIIGRDGLTELQNIRYGNSLASRVPNFDH